MHCLQIQLYLYSPHQLLLVYFSSIWQGDNIFMPSEKQVRKTGQREAEREVKWRDMTRRVLKSTKATIKRGRYLFTIKLVQPFLLKYEKLEIMTLTDTRGEEINILLDELSWVMWSILGLFGLWTISPFIYIYMFIRHIYQLKMFYQAIGKLIICQIINAHPCSADNLFDSNLVVMSLKLSIMRKWQMEMAA